jgi:hypothetical protein
MPTIASRGTSFHVTTAVAPNGAWIAHHHDSSRHTDGPAADRAGRCRRGEPCLGRTREAIDQAFRHLGLFDSNVAVGDLVPARLKDGRRDSAQSNSGGGRVMARCATCGAELTEGSDRFCGGDRCRRVLMKAPDYGSRAIAAPIAMDRERASGCDAGAFRQEVRHEVEFGVLQREAGNLGALPH